MNLVCMTNRDKKGPMVSPIVVGTMSWNEIDDDARESLFDSCLKLGMTTFDCADIYGGFTCEKLLGQVIGKRPECRKQIQLISKTNICFKFDGKPYNLKHYNSSKEHILQAVEASLKNLQTDYIDIYLLHRADALMDADEVAETMIELHNANKVLFFGVSNFSVHQFDLLQSRLPFALVTNQIEFSAWNMNALNDGTLDQCQRLSIRPMAWSVLRGIFKPETYFGAQAEDEGNKRRTAIVEALTIVADEIEKETNKKPLLDAVAYAFVQRHPSKALCITGTTKIGRLTKVVSSLELNLTREQWYRIWTASNGSEPP